MRFITQSIDKIHKFNDIDALFLYCGVGCKELHYTRMAHQSLSGLQYTVVVLMGDLESCEKHEETLCGNLNNYIAIDVRDNEVISELLLNIPNEDNN